MANVKIYDFSHEDFAKHLKEGTLSADYMLNLRLVSDPDFVTIVHNKIKTFARAPDDLLATTFDNYNAAVVGTQGKIAAKLVHTPMHPSQEEARLGLALLLEADQPDTSEGNDYLSNFISHKLPNNKVQFSRGILWPAAGDTTPVGGVQVKVNANAMYKFARYTLNPLLNQLMDAEMGSNPKQADAKARFERKLRRYPTVYNALNKFEKTDKANVSERLNIVREFLNQDLERHEKPAREALLFVLEAKCIGQAGHDKILALLRKRIADCSYAHSSDPEIQRQWKLRQKALGQLKRRIFLRKNVDRLLKYGIGVGGAYMFMKGYMTPNTPTATAVWQSLWAGTTASMLYATSLRRLFLQWKTYDRTLQKASTVFVAVVRVAAISVGSALGGELANDIYLMSTDGFHPSAEAKANNPFSRASDEFGKRAMGKQVNPVRPTPATAPTPAQALVSGAVSGAAPTTTQTGGVVTPAYTGIVVAIRHTPILKANDRTNVAASIPALPCARLMVTGDAGDGYWSVRVNGKDGYVVRSSHIAKGRGPAGTESCGRSDFAYQYDDKLLSAADAEQVITTPVKVIDGVTYGGVRVPITAPTRSLDAGVAAARAREAAKPTR